MRFFGSEGLRPEEVGANSFSGRRSRTAKMIRCAVVGSGLVERTLWLGLLRARRRLHHEFLQARTTFSLSFCRRETASSPSLYRQETPSGSSVYRRENCWCRHLLAWRLRRWKKCIETGPSPKSSASRGCAATRFGVTPPVRRALFSLSVEAEKATNGRFDARAVEPLRGDLGSQVPGYSRTAFKNCGRQKGGAVYSTRATRNVGSPTGGISF